ncbi:MAG: hypothetical protein ACYDDF_09740 [Thermoplasmatota archaeon]
MNRALAIGGAFVLISAAALTIMTAMIISGMNVFDIRAVYAAIFLLWRDVWTAVFIGLAAMVLGTAVRRDRMLRVRWFAFGLFLLAIPLVLPILGIGFRDPIGGFVNPFPPPCSEACYDPVPLWVYGVVRVSQWIGGALLFVAGILVLIRRGTRGAARGIVMVAFASLGLAGILGAAHYASALPSGYMPDSGIALSSLMAGVGMLLVMAACATHRFTDEQSGPRDATSSTVGGSER